MTLMGGGGEDPQPLSRGLSGIFGRKKAQRNGAAHGVYEAQDALDAAYLHPAAQTVQPRSGGGGGWGILSARRGSSTSSDTAAAYAHKQEHEAAALRAQCSAQVQELSVMAEAIEALREERAAAAERLNLQRFKFELLVDLAVKAPSAAALSRAFRSSAAARSASLADALSKKAQRNGAAHGVYEAQDALDAAYLHPAAQTVQPRSGGGGGWGILSARRGSSTSSDTAAAYAHKQEHEAAALRAQCSAQVQELSVMAEAIEALREERAAAAERLNLQRFKFELLVDLAVKAPSAAALSRAFRSSAAARSASLADALRNELAYEKQNYEQPPEVASGPPAGFTLTETKGDTLLTLSKQHGQETVEVDVLVNEQPGEELVEGENGELDADVGVVFTATVTKGDKSLVFECKSDGQYFAVQHVALEPAGDDIEESAYTGPVYDELDEELQGQLERYLAERGVNAELGGFLLPLVHDKEEREYIHWLEGVESFVRA
ncbi:mitochondrial glyco [Micractinium conductrix]|uniref:Mitochondrial glyco n=1 Tax=Micractinium conductrix TaxID=554055 RepID=A0A2P6VJS6_9CHLO|nr:mitochondrial glyco [Micractinium conductrix]|eukprot:PSC74310.1 mitochondrial glyco [Micractinium conductrix]